MTNEQSAELKIIAGDYINFFNETTVRSGLSDICNSEEYESLVRERDNPQGLIDLMENLEASTSAATEEFFRSRVLKTMNVEFYIKLMLWIDENIKPNITSVKIDHVKRSAALNRDLFKNFELICQ